MRKYSEAYERNKDPIVKELQRLLKDSKTVLEIGSGTGQHAIYFSRQLSYLVWQPSDLAINLESIRAWIDYDSSPNIESPIELDVTNLPWEVPKYNAIFSANTFHIMSWSQIENFFMGVSQVIEKDGNLIIYGPFSLNGIHTSPSNEQFDLYLKKRDPLSGVRDREMIDDLAKAQGLQLKETIPMPANNYILHWKRVGSA